MPTGVYERTEEHLKKIRENGFQKGHSVSLETRRKIGFANSIALKGRKMSEEKKIKCGFVKGCIPWNKGKRLCISYEIRQKMSMQRIGDKNPSWKGDNALYSAFHERVRAQRGTPQYCEVCKTIKAKRFEWANLTGTYCDINDYKRMCPKCHKQYDKKKRGTIRKGKECST